MSIEEVAQELYGLAPEEFTSTRNARAKQARDAGDRELAAAVQALRKPTAGAALLNRFVRRHEDEVSQVLELGARLRDAQGRLGAAELRALDQQRRQLTAAVARQVRALGEDDGRRVTNQVTADVEETLRSAMVDPAAGRALTTGMLTDTFSANGIDPVDLARVVALPALVDAGSSPPRAAPASRDGADAEPATEGAAEAEAEPEAEAERERRVASARAAVAQADSALEAARGLSRAAESAVAEAAGRHDRLGSERDELRRRLAELEAEVTSAAAQRAAAERAAEQAAQHEAEAHASAEQARRELDDLLG